MDVSKEQVGLFKKYAGGLFLFLLIFCIFLFSYFEDSFINNTGLAVEGTVVGGRQHMWGILRTVEFTYIIKDGETPRWSNINLFFLDNDFKIGELLKLKMNKNGGHIVIEGYVKKQQVADLLVMFGTAVFFIIFFTKMFISWKKLKKRVW